MVRSQIADHKRYPQGGADHFYVCKFGPEGELRGEGSRKNIKKVQFRIYKLLFRIFEAFFGGALNQKAFTYGVISSRIFQLWLQSLAAFQLEEHN